MPSGASISGAWHHPASESLGSAMGRDSIHSWISDSRQATAPPPRAGADADGAGKSAFVHLGVDGRATHGGHRFDFGPAQQPIKSVRGWLRKGRGFHCATPFLGNRDPLLAFREGCRVGKFGIFCPRKGCAPRFSSEPFPPVLLSLARQSGSSPLRTNSPNVVHSKCSCLFPVLLSPAFQHGRPRRDATFLFYPQGLNSARKSA